MTIEQLENYRANKVELSAITEEIEDSEVTQTQIANLTRVSQSQISKWERYGMDAAKLMNFIDVAKALHVNLRLLIWDEDLQTLYDEVT